MLKRLLADAPRFRPDAIEAFNPTTLGRPAHGRVLRFADEHHLATVGNSDAHALEAIGVGYTTFPGRTGADLRAAIGAGTTHHHGTFHGTTAQLGTFRHQLRKYGRDARANLGGRIRRDGSRRDLGYPVTGGAPAPGRPAVARRGEGGGGE
jgi:predicted metal-dependent phosphoesterase TrpH